ncbi:hypothetical protein F5B21DRAFT_520010 [Xylaria acuta]|nr:hypothetical protein F5B21DRAFT_520010 [Xylaria acuta]
MITVDEDNWFPFLRRDRWYDLYGQKQVPSGKMWSIDQPKLWQKLRVSVELADRMLKALINDRHPALHTMLFGTLMRWSDASAMQPSPEPFPDAKVLLSYGLYKSFCDLNELDCPIDHLADISTEDWTIVLEGLLQFQTWGFTDDPDDNGSHWPGYGSVITLGVNVIDTLSGDDITLAERCQLQYQLARTFIDFDGIAELGYAMEQRVFGGVVTSLHLTGHYPLGSHHRSWPFLSQAAGDSQLGYKIRDHPTFAAVQDVIVSPLPALYTSKLLSRSFWDDANIPRKSDNFFHRNQLLVGRTEFIPSNQLRWQDVTVDRAKLSRGEVDPGEPEMSE